MSSPVVQQLDGMEGAGPDVSLPDVSGSAFQRALPAIFWPMAFPNQYCRRECGGWVEQDEADPYDGLPPGWVHAGECP